MPPGVPEHRLLHAGKQLLIGLVDLVYPPQCLLCGQPLAESVSGGLCPTCLGQLTGDAATTCPRCAATVGPHTVVGEGCPLCAKDSFQFDRACRLGRYAGKRREAILALKHLRGEALAETLGLLLADALRDELAALSIDAVVPVPLHWLRSWQRGYNQAEAVARSVAGALKKPCRTRWLWRRRHTPAQTTQTPTDRRRQMRGTFRAALPRKSRGASILLIDDVLTTGSTCNDAARALREAGAGRVVVAVLGRAEP